jgi:hypothetical protein
MFVLGHNVQLSGRFQGLMNALIAEAAARGDVESRPECQLAAPEVSLRLFSAMLGG